jgi:phosphoribosylanthranilate isomerase
MASTELLLSLTPDHEIKSGLFAAKVVYCRSMRVKICGITRVEDMKATCLAGADLVGINFYAPSPRSVSGQVAGELLCALQPPTVAVAVTVNADDDLLDRLADRFQVIQLSGDEGPAVADRLIANGLKVIKAFGVPGRDFVGPIRDWLDGVADRGGVLAVLLDAMNKQAGQYGGTGRRFNWDHLADAIEAGELEGLPPVMLAGGLNPKNVRTAVRDTRPWGVDVAGGVEVEDRPGVKSIDRIRDFIRAARTA